MLLTHLINISVHLKLLKERERSFKEELETMSGVLKAQFEVAAKEYKST